MKCDLCGQDSVSDASTPEDPYPCMNPNRSPQYNTEAAILWRAMERIVEFAKSSQSPEAKVNVIQIIAERSLAEAEKI